MKRNRDNLGYIIVGMLTLSILVNVYLAGTVTNIKSNYDACQTNIQELRDDFNRRGE